MSTGTTSQLNFDLSTVAGQCTRQYPCQIIVNSDQFEPSPNSTQMCLTAFQGTNNNLPFQQNLDSNVNFLTVSPCIPNPCTSSYCNYSTIGNTNLPNTNIETSLLNQMFYITDPKFTDGQLCYPQDSNFDDCNTATGNSIAGRGLFSSLLDMPVGVASQSLDPDSGGQLAVMPNGSGDNPNEALSGVCYERVENFVGENTRILNAAGRYFDAYKLVSYFRNSGAPVNSPLNCSANQGTTLGATQNGTPNWCQVYQPFGFLSVYDLSSGGTGTIPLNNTYFTNNSTNTNVQSGPNCGPTYFTDTYTLEGLPSPYNKYVRNSYALEQLYQNYGQNSQSNLNNVFYNTTLPSGSIQFSPLDDYCFNLSNNCSGIDSITDAKAQVCTNFSSSNTMSNACKNWYTAANGSSTSTSFNGTIDNLFNEVCNSNLIPDCYCMFSGQILSAFESPGALAGLTGSAYVLSNQLFNTDTSSQKQCWWKPCQSAPSSNFNPYWYSQGYINYTSTPATCPDICVNAIDLTAYNGSIFANGLIINQSNQCPSISGGSTGTSGGATGATGTYINGSTGTSGGGGSDNDFIHRLWVNYKNPIIIVLSILGIFVLIGIFIAIFRKRGPKSTTLRDASA